MKIRVGLLAATMMLLPLQVQAQQTIKLECRATAMAGEAPQRDPVTSVIITFSPAILEEGHKLSLSDSFSVIHVTASGTKYSREDQYIFKQISYHQNDLVWFGLLKKAGDVSMTGVLSNIHGKSPVYMERIHSTTSGQPPKIIDSATCTPLPQTQPQLSQAPALAENNPALETLLQQAKPAEKPAIPAAGAPLADQQQPYPGAPTVAFCRLVKETEARLRCYDGIPAPGAGPAPMPELSMKIETSQEVILGKWSGVGAQRTRPFHADGPWELQWTTGAGHFSAWLHSLPDNGDAVGNLLANQSDASSSSSFQPNGGDFYMEFNATSSWTARAVALPNSILPRRQKAVEQKGLLEVEGDQSGLPSCDTADGKAALKRLIENSPFGKTFNISVLHIGDITSRAVAGGMLICSGKVLTNGGERTYEFQYYRKDGEVFVFGRPQG